MKQALLTALVLALSTACTQGPAGPKGDPGDPGVQGVAGAPGERGPRGDSALGGNLIQWGSDPATWTFLTGVEATLTVDATDSREGESSFNFAVASGTQGASYLYGDFIPVDASRYYRGRIWAKLVAGAGPFSAGFMAYNEKKEPLVANGGFIAQDTALKTGEWYELTGLVGGEGPARDRFPPGTRFIKPGITVNGGNLGTTRVDGFALYPEEPFRTLVRNQAKLTETMSAGPLNSRAVVIQKRAPTTGLRVVWSDQLKVEGAVDTSGCRWEVKFNGAPCANPGPVVIEKVTGTGPQQKLFEQTTLIGTCNALPPGRISIALTADRPADMALTPARCTAGAPGQIATLEVEEVR